MRIVFAGTPEFAADILEALLAASAHEVVAVYTQPDRPKGRGKKLVPSAVKSVAVEHEIPVFQPLTLRDADALDTLRALKPDVMIVAAYGLILPADVLKQPPHGCINVHASLLPRWRGAAPIERAIEAGDKHSGVTIMQMDTGLDTGDMLVTGTCDIEPDDNGQSLREKLTNLGIECLLKTLEQIDDGSLIATPQDDALANYAPKLNRAEANIDWSLPADQLERRIRAFWPNNTCQTYIGDTRLNIIHAASVEGSTFAPGTIIRADRNGIAVACGQGSALVITRLQLAGGKPMDAAAMLNGRADMFEPGTCFGQIK